MNNTENKLDALIDALGFDVGVSYIKCNHEDADFIAFDTSHRIEYKFKKRVDKKITPADFGAIPDKQNNTITKYEERVQLVNGQVYVSVSLPFNKILVAHDHLDPDTQFLELIEKTHYRRIPGGIELFELYPERAEVIARFVNKYIPTDVLVKNILILNNLPEDDLHFINYTQEQLDRVLEWFGDLATKQDGDHLIMGVKVYLDE